MIKYKHSFLRVFLFSLVNIFTISVYVHGSAIQKMYWLDSTLEKIRCANTDGTEIEDIISYNYSTNPISAFTLDTVNNKIYWTDDGAEVIRRANFDGSGIEDVLVLSPNVNIGNITLDSMANKMYWMDRSIEKIRRANIDGTEIEDIISYNYSANPISAFTLDTVNNKIYWTDDGAEVIRRANFDGSGIEDVLVLSPNVNIGNIALTIPEPCTLCLLGCGVAVLLRKRNRPDSSGK